MELKWLEDFLSLAATQSFSRADHERNVTQSGVSRPIPRLEKWLSVPLFDRSTSPLPLARHGSGHSGLDSRCPGQSCPCAPPVRAADPLPQLRGVLFLRARVD